jgi:CHAT domain-containing protein
MGVEDEARALEALDLAYEIWHSLGPRYRGAARSALETIVMIRQLSGDYAGALAWFEKMDAESDESGDSKDEADAQMQKGTLLLALGQPAQAEELLLKFSEHASPAQPNYRLGLQQLTACQVLMGKTQQAAQSTRKIMDLEKREVEQGLSTLIENLTPDETAHTLNLYVSYLKSLDAVAEKADQSDVENVGRMLDQSKLLIGQYAGTNTLSYAQQTLALATVQIQAGQFREAEHPLLDAKATFTQLYGEKDATIMTHLQLASVRLGLGRFAEAEADLQKILSYYRDAHGENALVQAASQLLLANVYAVTDRPGKSVSALSSAMEAQQGALERLFEFSNESTMRDYLQTIRPSQDMLMSLFARKQIPMDLLSQAAMNWTLRRKGLILDALCEFRRLQETLAQNEDIALKVGSLRNLRHQLANLQSDPARLMREANLDSSHDKTGPRSWQEALRVRESALQTQIESLEAELTRLLHAKSSTQNHALITWQTVRDRLPQGSALVEFVRASVYDFDAVKLPADKRWQSGRYFALVLSKSNPEPALVYIGEANEIDDLVHRFRSSIQDGGRSVGAVAMEVEDDQVSSRPKQGHPDDSLQLSRILLAPLEKHLQKIDTLYLAPDGELNLVPFAALIEADGKFLVENRKLVYLSSGRDLLRAPEPFGAGTLIFAGPDYNANPQQARPTAPVVALTQSTKSTSNRRSQETGGLIWSRLPGAESEASEVQLALKDPQYAPVSLFTGTNATEESFKNVQSPRILHVATHGYFLPDLQSSSRHQRSAADDLIPNRTLTPLELAGLAENPLLRCGMVLAGANNRSDDKAIEDGWVTAEEISMINLRGTQLVVLSACETGLGDVRAGEGVYGLRRAFINAGVRSLLTSLFKVPDKETCQLMGHFYRGINQGQDAATALREAQISIIKQLRQDYGKAPIVLWAGFIQVGEWK